MKVFIVFCSAMITGFAGSTSCPSAAPGVPGVIEASSSCTGTDSSFANVSTTSFSSNSLDFSSVTPPQMNPVTSGGTDFVSPFVTPSVVEAPVFSTSVAPSITAIPGAGTLSTYTPVTYESTPVIQYTYVPGVSGVPGVPGAYGSPYYYSGAPGVGTISSISDPGLLSDAPEAGSIAMIGSGLVVLSLTANSARKKRR